LRANKSYNDAIYLDIFALICDTSGMEDDPLAGTLRSAEVLARRFDGPIPPHLREPPGAAALAQRGALATLERMLAEYLDEAERLEGRIFDLERESSGGGCGDLEVARARYAASIRSARWAMRAVDEQRRNLGLAPHPIIAATQMVEAAE
jgi:hypothetical protein